LRVLVEDLTAKGEIHKTHVKRVVLRRRKEPGLRSTQPQKGDASSPRIRRRRDDDSLTSSS
jgi:hypothetical protein